MTIRGIVKHNNGSNARAALASHREKEEREERSRKRAQCTQEEREERSNKCVRHTQEEECPPAERSQVEDEEREEQKSHLLAQAKSQIGHCLQELLQIPPDQRNTQAKILRTLIESANIIQDDNGKLVEAISQAQERSIAETGAHEKVHGADLDVPASNSNSNNRKGKAKDEDNGEVVEGNDRFEEEEGDGEDEVEEGEVGNREDDEHEREEDELEDSEEDRLTNNHTANTSPGSIPVSQGRSRVRDADQRLSAFAQSRPGDIVARGPDRCANCLSKETCIFHKDDERCISCFTGKHGCPGKGTAMTAVRKGGQGAAVGRRLETQNSTCTKSVPRSDSLAASTAGKSPCSWP
ncbi:uncharacterized protein PHACADRAFT_30635 [Phanerochaete carnosa HHB-10118-sp]|uniref:Uncharacterized protein n=1 Tax=Phanerochaete carnosa (strain HHB-10118-sp) TaxID=650164 RepID=K5W3G9_PHACS|nr:uncharacterized protein PHACADRAFT_30635 [Phanerochaete carnosa HHB-10118-sp]EKM53680.1 hypothetical protein PHACADRAFT_30635 [Phanerochaete carnosa HHB-10118-sp]